MHQHGVEVLQCVMQDLPLAKQQQQRRDDREEMPMALMWELTATLSKMDESSLTGASSRLDTSMLILLLGSALELGSQR